MAPHHYQQVPSTEELHPLPEYTPPQTQTQTQSNSPIQYFSGVPTSAPPSFASAQPAVPVITKCAHETTTTTTTTTPEIDDGVSIWAPSEDLVAATNLGSMEDAMVRLMDRVEVLEGRLDLNLDLESGGARKEQMSSLAKDKWKREDVLVLGFVVWFCAVLTWWVVAK